MGCSSSVPATHLTVLYTAKGKTEEVKLFSALAPPSMKTLISSIRENNTDLNAINIGFKVKGGKGESIKDAEEYKTVVLDLQTEKPKSSKQKNRALEVVLTSNNIMLDLHAPKVEGLICRVAKLLGPKDHIIGVGYIVHPRLIIAVEAIPKNTTRFAYHDDKGELYFGTFAQSDAVQLKNVMLQIFTTEKAVPNFTFVPLMETEVPKKVQIVHCSRDYPAIQCTDAVTALPSGDSMLTYKLRP
jgi:hypothetical protein